MESFEVQTVWLKFWRFEIQICQMTSDGDWNDQHIKVVDLAQNNNFVVDDFLSEVVYVSKYLF
jgi:hypothetical protein